MSADRVAEALAVLEAAEKAATPGRLDWVSRGFADIMAAFDEEGS